MALHFIMQDDIFFLKEDMERYAEPVRSELTPIIDEEENIVVAVPATEVEFTFMGKKSELLILVHYTGLEFIHETHLLALENILKRKNLAVADVAILNIANHTGADYEALLSYFNPQKILVLGKQALPASIVPLCLNQPNQLGNKNILYSFSFDEMMDSPDNKKAFWEQMKNF